VYGAWEVADARPQSKADIRRKATMVASASNFLKPFPINIELVSAGEDVHLISQPRPAVAEGVRFITRQKLVSTEFKPVSS
jgi:hypothetical protein